VKYYNYPTAYHSELEMILPRYRMPFASSWRFRPSLGLHNVMNEKDKAKLIAIPFLLAVKALGR
jgi:hypothetical protein